MKLDLTLAELARWLDAELRAPGEVVIRGVATLASATPEQLAFLANPAYRPALASTRAAAVIVDPPTAATHAGPVMIVEQPYVAYARAATRFDTRPRPVPGLMHPTAIVAADAQVDRSASLGALCVIEAGVRIGAGTTIDAHGYVGHGAQVGRDCVIGPRVTLMDGVRLGDRVRIHAGAVIGADGFGIARAAEGWIKVPQLGAVQIGNDVEIGANTTIDRGSIDDTVIGDDVRIDNLVQIAHNVVIGAHTAIAGAVAIAGSTRIGRDCLIGGGVGIVGHLEIADRVTLLARTLVTQSILSAGVYSSSIGAQPARTWRRNAARLARLDHDWRRLHARSHATSDDV